MTHSLDSFITDSANSATALASGKKATVNGLNAYTDSTGLAFNDPKVETIYEMFRRICTSPLPRLRSQRLMKILQTTAKSESSPLPTSPTLRPPLWLRTPRSARSTPPSSPSSCRE